MLSIEISYKVSVLVSVYEDEPYIERCARNLFEQTYTDLEYIFVDNCSPDNSIVKLEKVMNDYPERKASVKILRNEVNRGLAAVRKTAFDYATRLKTNYTFSRQFFLAKKATKKLKHKVAFKNNNIFK